MRRALALLAVCLAAQTSRAQVLPDGDCAGVYWDLTAAFESGDRVYARVLVTHAGPGDRNAAGFGYWIERDGTETQFQNGRSDTGFEFADTGDQVRIGSTHLDLRGGAAQFEVDNDKRAVKLRVSVETAALASVAVFGGDPEVDLLALGRPTTARAWHKGMPAPNELRGFATLVRTRHRGCESDLVAQRFDVHRLPPGGASLLIHERRVGGAQRSWLGWRSERGELLSLRPEAIDLEDWRAEPDGPPTPRRLRAVSGAVQGAIAVGAPRLSIDPLDALPGVVRMLYWFGARPRRIWADATSELVAKGHELPRGPAIASLSFLRPPEASNPSRSRDSGG